MEIDRSHEHQSFDPRYLDPSLLRLIGGMMNLLVEEGMVIWRDGAGLWRWRWEDTGLESPRGIGSFGTALVAAMTARYPEVMGV
ncbi:MAG: hypothetical protein OHK0022_18180 [Roseiflexaceae bacterium]